MTKQETTLIVGLTLCFMIVEIYLINAMLASIKFNL